MDAHDLKRLLGRDWLRLNGLAARNAADAMRADAQRADERQQALSALGERRGDDVRELRRA